MMDGEVDSVLASVREAIVQTHSVLGVLGSGGRGERALLVRTRDEGRLEVALLQPTGDDGTMELSLVDRLDASTPANAIPCPYCERQLRVWGRHCTRCGKDLSGLSATGVGLSPEDMLAQIREIAGESFDVFGSVPRREGGGEVYFARDTETNRLVALRLEAQPGTAVVDRHYTLGVTGMLGVVSETPFPIPEPQIRASEKEPVQMEAVTDMLGALRQQSEGEYEVYGELGRLGPTHFFLARELASGDLIALRLSPSNGGYAMRVERRLDRSLSEGGSICAGCGAVLALDAEGCGRCARPLSSGGRSPQEREDERARLRELSEATHGEYEFLGEMERSGEGSVVYFARRATDGSIVGVRCERSPSFANEDAFSIRETGVLRAVTGGGALEDGGGRAVRGPVPPSTGAREKKHAVKTPPPTSDMKRMLMPAIVAGFVSLAALLLVMRACA